MLAGCEQLDRPGHQRRRRRGHVLIQGVEEASIERLLIGLVGCGGMGRRHLRAYALLQQLGIDGFRIAAVCDPDPAAAEAAAEQVEAFQGTKPQLFRDHTELLDAGAVEAFDVVTDPAVHHVVAVPALDRGVHVICEKPLGITVRACRQIVEAADRSGATLATAENYRRDPTNRLARAVIDAGLLGDVHLLTQIDVGGDDRVIISPWRHIREAGSIALDMGVHYTDIAAYLLGELETVSGASFIAEPFRTVADGAAQRAGIDEVSAGVIRATGDDSLVALFEASSGAFAQLAYLPSGPGHHWLQRTVHGRSGSLSIPPDRTGGPVVVQLGERILSGAELRREVGNFELDGVSARLFGREGTEYNLPFADVDAATIAIELEDFVDAVASGGAPELDGPAGLRAVAAVWSIAESRACGGVVSVRAVADGELSSAQDSVDLALGLRTSDGRLS